MSQHLTTIANKRSQPSTEKRRVPIKEQEAIDALNPLVEKDNKTIDDMRQESDKLFKVVISQSSKAIDI